MKQHHKLSTKERMVINRGKRSKTVNEVKPIKNIISYMQKEVLPI